MRFIYCLPILLLSLMLLSGCARYPTGNEGLPAAPAQTIYAEITVKYLIDPTVYYFFAIDTNGISNEGPVPSATGIGFGNGWGVLSPVNPNGPVQQPSFFVQIYNNTASMWRVQPAYLTSGANIGQIGSMTAQSLGQPYRWGFLAQDRTPALSGPILYVEIDTSLLMPPATPANPPYPEIPARSLPGFVNVNWITVQGIPPLPQRYRQSNVI